MGSKFVGAVGAASVVVGLIVSSGAQTGIAATPAVPHAISFSDVAEDAVIATKLLGVQTLIAEDGARAIKSARPLASRIERTDAAMTTLCTDIINDASAGLAPRSRRIITALISPISLRWSLTRQKA